MRRRIAGILDCHGGLRVVVGAEESIYANCSIVSPERLFLMPPDCWVDTDETDHIPWNMIPWTVRRVELYKQLRQVELGTCVPGLGGPGVPDAGALQVRRFHTLFEQNSQVVLGVGIALMCSLIRPY